MITVQPSHPRYQSLRMQLAAEIWENGISTFFTEYVPFSVTTGKEFASKIAELWASYLKLSNLPKTDLHILEFGAGLGMLSKHLLDMIKTEHAVLYDQTFFHISDSSDIIYQELQDLDVFKDHLYPK